MGDFVLLLEAAKFFNYIKTSQVQSERRFSRWTSNSDNRTGNGPHQRQWAEPISVASKQTLGHA